MENQLKMSRKAGGGTREQRSIDYVFCVSFGGPIIASRRRRAYHTRRAGNVGPLHMTADALATIEITRLKIRVTTS